MNDLLLIIWIFSRTIIVQRTFLAPTVDNDLEKIDRIFIRVGFLDLCSSFGVLNPMNIVFIGVDALDVDRKREDDKIDRENLV